MADGNHLKIDDRIEEDDPFAELTKIMGFDPRQPANQPKPVPQPVAAPADDLSIDDDFSIDLEKELMGEFGLDDEPEVAAEPVRLQQQAEPLAYAAGYASEDEAYSAEYGAEAELEDELSVESEAVADDFDLEGELEEELAIAAAQASARPVDLWGNDEPEQAYEPEAAYEPEVAAETAVAAVSLDDEDFAADFDAAMADVDMDFATAAPALGLAPGSDEPEFEAAGHDEPEFETADEESVEPVTYDAMPIEAQATDALDIEFDELESVELQEVELPEESPAPPAFRYRLATPQIFANDDAGQEVVAAHDSPDFLASETASAFPVDVSLEDELNALLGNRTPRALATEDVSLSRGNNVAETSGDPMETENVADDLDWSYENDRPRSASEERVDDPDFARDHQYDALAPADDIPDFDHDAFDAAIATGFDTSDSAETAPVTREDPLDVIEALAAEYTQRPAVSEEIELPRAYHHDEVPDVETVDVAEQAVALADDLDIPELAFEDEIVPVSAYDDIDAEFSSLLHDMNASQPRSALSDDSPVSYRDDAGELHAGYGIAAAGAVAAAPVRSAFDNPERYELDADNLPGSDPLDQSGFEVAGYNDGLALDDEADFVPAAAALPERRPPQRRGMLVAGIVAGVALVGGLGAFALSFGDGSSGSPAIVKADDTPIKVKPENPGGTTVPNQDSKVYETVAGEGQADDPQQEKLVTSAEEPIDVSPPIPEPRAIDLTGEADAEAAITPKGEDRISQIVQDAEADPDLQVAAIAPRKVRTMVVKPDGTLVPREDPEPVDAVAPEPVAPQAAATAAAAIEAAPAETPGTPEETVSLPAETIVETAVPVASAPVVTAPVAQAPVSQPAAPEAAPVAVAAAPAPAAEVAAPPSGVEAPAGDTAVVAALEAPDSAMPETAPIAPQRPANQPLEVVGEVKPDQVAAISTSATTNAGSWSMQIASQPTEAAAKSSYKDLARRYGGVLEGRDVSIVKAEIAGKGTFWRVRVPAASRNEAITLCESYKSAGGNCFVSR